jgi:hypothetical protein
MGPADAIAVGIAAAALVELNDLGQIGCSAFTN